jgi:sugar/nucleoside kinase (ribokinase family)
VLVACLGDIMLDVIVDAPQGLVPDDDTPARITFAAGGQAANVATWVVALGGRARVFGPRSDSAPGRLVEEALTSRGVEVWGTTPGRLTAVVSLTSHGSRSIASDPGDLRWLEEITAGRWLRDADWLFVSGYTLLRTSDPQRIVQTAAVARAHGTRIAVDLASAVMMEQYGAAAFSDLVRNLKPAVVFATDTEWATSPGSFGAGGLTVLVLKHGADGATFVIDGIADDRPAEPGPLLDVTGAGDALAAGFLVAGADLAMQAAARCVAQMGALPPRCDE